MEYSKIKNTDLNVSRICMGGCPMGGYGWGAVQETELIDAVQAALDNGINFFDTADTYGLGQSEITLAKALGDRDTETRACAEAETDDQELNASGGANRRQSLWSKELSDDGRIRYIVKLLKQISHQHRKHKFQDEAERTAFCHIFHVYNLPCPAEKTGNAAGLRQ